MDLNINRRCFMLLAASAAVAPVISVAQTGDDPSLQGAASSADPLASSAAPGADAAAPERFTPVLANTLDDSDMRYIRRPVIVFADSPQDPNFIRQMELFPRLFDELARRDVILITDTDPANPSALRKRLRPRGFALVIMDKDWGSAIRKPLPWDGREVINAIDRMPIARTEALERSPAGR